MNIRVTGISRIFESKMDAPHIIDAIANISFRNGKIVFGEERDTLKLYYQLMTQVFLLRKGLMLTFPEKFEECENKPCPALTCFCVLKLFGSHDLSDLPSGVCGCPFKHSDMWIKKSETKVENITKSNRGLQEAVSNVIRTIEAMELPARDCNMYRTAYNIKDKTFHIVPLPQFDREDVFYAANTSRSHPTKSRGRAVPQRGAAEAAESGEARATQSDPRASATRGSWSHVAAVRTTSLDKNAASAAAAESESKVMQLRRLLEQEEAKLAELSDTKAALERKKKADAEAVELEAKLAEVRAKFNAETGAGPTTPMKVVFPRQAPVIVAVKSPKAGTNGGAEATAGRQESAVAEDGDEEKAE